MPPGLACEVMDAGTARARLRELESTLLGLLQAGYPNWEIKDDGNVIVARRKRRSDMASQELEAESLPALWVALDLYDRLPEGGPDPARVPHSRVHARGTWAGPQ